MTPRPEALRRGSWRIDRDATVVAGTEGVIRRSLPAYDHYSMLASIEDRFKLPRLGQAVHASPMDDLLMSMPTLTRHGG